MMPDFDHSQLMTRRHGLALLGSAGSGFLAASAASGIMPANALSSEAHDYVAEAASACTLTAEQEEGPYYVALERVLADIVEGQVGLPLTLQITSPISMGRSSSTRSIRATTRASPPTSTPRSISTHTRRATRSTAVTSPTQVQMFPPDAVNTEVYKLSPYSTETATIVTHAEGRVWTQQHGDESKLKVTLAGSRLKEGLIGQIVLGVNPNATPASVGPTGIAP